MPALDAFSHISLTVTDPQRSADFYHQILGMEIVSSTIGDTGSLIVVARPGLTIALRDHPEAHDESFDPSRIGLDHVAFLVPSRAELEAWQTSLIAAGVVCSPIEVSPFGLHLNLKDPDEIAVELFVSEPA
ncbi:MAG TPA: VOC family protein [Kribbella sp.]|nr:VOC family protein [Kribbella sp.]